MAIPESIKKYRPKGTEIQEHSGHYYVYKVKAYYDAAAKKSKRRSEGCIGQIYENIGFVANESTVSIKSNSVKEYGITAIIYKASEQIRKDLLEVFGADALRLYVMAILKLLTNSNQKNLEAAYQRSYISELIPNVHLSKNTVSDFLERIALSRQNIVAFFKKLTNEDDVDIMFDGSSFQSGSACNPYAQTGYNPLHPGNTQIRLIYAYNSAAQSPVYFNLFPGNVTDNTAFSHCIAESGMKNCTLILDKGFFSEHNLITMAENDLNFIISMPDGRKEVKEVNALTFDRDARFFHYHKRTVFYRTVNDNYLDRFHIIAFFDIDRRRTMLKEYYRYKKIPDTVPEEMAADIEKHTRFFGFTFLVASKDIPADEVYKRYKSRWAIEEMFDTHKNTLSFDMSYETKENVQAGWAFVEFLALLIYHRTAALLSSSDETASLSVSDAKIHFGGIVKCFVNQQWETWNINKNTLALFDSLGIPVA